MATRRRSDSGPSSRMARIVPTTRVMGAAARIVSDITTSIWTCWTSLVIRVISDGAPNSPTSRAENPVTEWKMLARTSRPKAVATREPTRMAATLKMTWTIDTASITAPSRRT